MVSGSQSRLELLLKVKALIIFRMLVVTVEEILGGSQQSGDTFKHYTARYALKPSARAHTPITNVAPANWATHVSRRRFALTSRKPRSSTS